MANLEEFGINEEELTKITQTLIENLVWFETHKNKFKEEYANKHIAIHDKKIIDSDKDLALLKERMKEKGLNLNYVLFKFVPLKDMIIIL